MRECCEFSARFESFKPACTWTLRLRSPSATAGCFTLGTAELRRSLDYRSKLDHPFRRRQLAGWTANWPGRIRRNCKLHYTDVRLHERPQKWTSVPESQHRRTTIGQRDHSTRIKKGTRFNSRALDRSTGGWFGKKLVRQLEIDRDLRLDLDGFSIQQVRFVFPLLDGI